METGTGVEITPVANGDQAAGDYKLIEQIQSGQKELYAHFVRRYHGKVMGYCLSMLQNHAEAEDAAQDVFLKAYRSLGRFRGDSSFSTWIYRIAANHCLDTLRKRNRRKNCSLDALMETEGESVHRSFATPALADSRMENRDLADKILSGLPKDYRVILVLREAGGLDYKQIAEVLNCSLDKVKGCLCRARRKLREELRIFWDQNEAGLQEPADFALRAFSYPAGIGF